MKGPLALLLSLLLLLPLGARGAGPGGQRVVVLKSSDLAAYAAVVAGFSAEVRGEVSEVLLSEHPDVAARQLEAVRAQAPALVLAVGPTAANAGRVGLTEVPLLFTMVPYYERYGLEGPRVTGIALTGDFTQELAALKALAPGTKKVGVLHDPRFSAATVRALQAAAETQKLKVVPLPADSEQQAERVLAGLGARVDALLLVADKTMGSAELVRRLIDFCAAERLPLVALSGSQVREGALLSLAPSYVGVGQQAGRLANRIVHEKVDPGALAVARPEVLELSINLTTARKLGDTGALAERLLHHAAQQGFSLKVYE
jgi:putative ABC transport system substrate-binding protein